MEPMVLVTYATRNGSTKEVAEVVAETLRGNGLAVECAAVSNVRRLRCWALAGCWLHGVLAGRANQEQKPFLVSKIAIFA